MTRIGAVPVFVDATLAAHRSGRVERRSPHARRRSCLHLYGQTPTSRRSTRRRQAQRSRYEEAQSQGASSTYGRAGALARVAATSFYPGKNLGAGGDAGAIMTNDDEVAAFVRNYAAHGSTVKYVHDRAGVNSRLDAVQAPVLRAKLRRLDAWNAARRAAADRYAELLADIPGVTLPVTRPGNVDVWHLCVVDQRERVMAELGAAGTGAIHYPFRCTTAACADLGYAKGQPDRQAAASCRCHVST